LLRHLEESGYTLKDFDGYTILEYDIAINNGFLCLSPQITYEIFSKLSIGTGINVNLLLFSTSRVKDYEEINLMRNSYYSTFNFGLPVFIMFQGENFFMKFRFDKGLVNLMKDSNSYFKEIEDTFTLSFGYFIFNRGSTSSEQ